MAYEPELERLERRYQDDPARNFAQLAETYRKAGRLDDALILLRGHLAERPNYVSGLVVLGRCLLDQHDDGEARETFERVLGVDAEHIIALRALGEIAERGNDPVQARTWFGRLLEIDPMNDEAEAAMQRLAQAAAAPAPPPPTESQAEPEPSLGEMIQQEMAAEAPPATPAAPAAPAAPAEDLRFPPSEFPADSGYPDAAEIDLAQLPDPRAFTAAAPVEKAEEAEEAEENEYQVKESTDAFMPRATYAQPIDVEQIGQIDIASSLPDEEPLISAAGDLPEEYSFPSGEREVDFGFGDMGEETTAGTAGEAGTAGLTADGLEPTPADLSEVVPPGEDLGVQPFDDELGWGAGERVSRQISREDLAEAAKAHEEDLEAAAVTELPGLEDTELPAGEAAAAPPVEGLELVEAPAEVVPVAGLEPAEGAGEEEPPVEFITMSAPEPEEALDVVNEEVLPVVPEAQYEAPEGTFDPSGEVVDRATAERRASLFGLPLIEEPPPESPLVLDAQPEPVVTETMAELYANQGLTAEARDVYEQLLRQRPGDARLRARLAELGRPGARTTRYAASETGGPSVRAMLLDLLASRPGAPVAAVQRPVAPVAPVALVAQTPMDRAFGGGPSDEESMGAPTRPAADEVSLAAIFGDSAAPAPAPEPAPPPMKEPATKPTRSGGGFSFDEFFGKPAAGQAKPDDKSRRDTLADDEGEEAFKDWLRGLKS